MSNDTLESIAKEMAREGARMLAGLKSRAAHRAYMRHAEARLADLGLTYIDVLRYRCGDLGAVGGRRPEMASR